MAIGREKLGHRVRRPRGVRSHRDVGNDSAEYKYRRRSAKDIQSALSTLTPRRSAALHRSASLLARGTPSRINASTAAPKSLAGLLIRERVAHQHRVVALGAGR